MSLGGILNFPWFLRARCFLLPGFLSDTCIREYFTSNLPDYISMWWSWGIGCTSQERHTGSPQWRLEFAGTVPESLFLLKDGLPSRTVMGRCWMGPRSLGLYLLALDLKGLAVSLRNPSGLREYMWVLWPESLNSFPLRPQPSCTGPLQCCHPGPPAWEKTLWWTHLHQGGKS